MSRGALGRAVLGALVDACEGMDEPARSDEEASLRCLGQRNHSSAAVQSLMPAANAPLGIDPHFCS